MMQRTVFFMILALSTPLAVAEFDGSESALRQLVSDSVADELGITPDFVQLGTFDQRLNIQSCQQDVTVSFPFTGNRDTVRVQCSQPSWQLFLPIRIEEPPQLWVLQDAVSQGDTLKRAQITAIYQQASHSNGISVDQNILGWLVTRDLPAGHVLTLDDVESANQVMIATESVPVGGLIDDTRIAYQSRADQEITAQPVPLGLDPQSVLRATQPIEAMEPLTRANTEVLQSVLTVRDNLPRDTILEARHLEHRLVEQTDLGRRVIQDPKAAIGLQTTRALRTGHILNTTDLTDATLVRQGESVTLIMTSGALEVRADTLALEDGKQGDQIRLQTLDSGNTVRATVIGRNLAKRMQ